MKAAFLLLLAALPVLYADPYPDSGLALYTRFEHLPSPVVIEAIQEEVGSILSPIGVRFSWHDLSNAAGKQFIIRAAVVEFKGHCDSADLTPYPQFAWVLGRTHVSDGQILPFSDIFCDAIRAFAAAPLTALEPAQREITFARAVARVIAHELFHVFAETVRHGAHGLGKPEYSVTELTSDRFVFRASDLKRLRDSLLPTLLQLTGEPPNSVDRGTAVFVQSGCGGCHGFNGEGARWGPALYVAAHGQNPKGVVGRLKGTSSEMYRRAKRLSVPWPRLSDEDVSSLVVYLRGISR